MRLFIAFVSLVFISSAGNAQANESEASPPPFETRIAAVEKQLGEAERRNLILEAKSEIEDQAYTRFEIGMGGLGLLITLLVIVFGFRTEKSAMRAAQAEVSDRKDQIDKLLEIARSAADAAQASATSAASHEGHAATSAAQAQESSRVVSEAALVATQVSFRRSDEATTELTETQRAAVEEGVREAKDTRESELSVDEFKARIAKAAYIDKDFVEALRLARGMAFIYSGDQEALSYALIEEGYYLSKLGRDTEAIDVFNNLINRFADSQDNRIRSRVYLAYLNRAVSIGKARGFDAELAEYEMAEKLIGDEPSDEDKYVVATLLVNKGVTFTQMEKSEEAIATYREVDRRFYGEQSPEIQECVSRALYNLGCRLGAMGRREEELETYNKIISTYPLPQPLAVADRMAMTLVNKAVTLGILGRPDEEISTYEEVISLRESDSPEIAKQISMAYLYKGITLKELGRDDQVIETLDELVTRLKKYDNEDVRERLSKAFYILAATHAKAGRHRSAVSKLKRLLMFDGKLPIDAIESDSDFDMVRNSQGFRKLLKESSHLSPDVANAGESDGA